MHVTHQTSTSRPQHNVNDAGQSSDRQTPVMPLIKTKAHTGRPQCNATDQSQSSHKHRQTSVQCHWSRPKLTQGSQPKLRKEQADLSVTPLTTVKAQTSTGRPQFNATDWGQNWKSWKCGCCQFHGTYDAGTWLCVQGFYPVMTTLLSVMTTLHSVIILLSKCNPHHRHPMAKTKPVLRFIPQPTHDSM